MRHGDRGVTGEAELCQLMVGKAIVDGRLRHANLRTATKAFDGSQFAPRRMIASCHGDDVILEEVGSLDRFGVFRAVLTAISMALRSSASTVASGPRWTMSRLMRGHLWSAGASRGQQQSR
jgi:hypothetical protein